MTDQTCSDPAGDDTWFAGLREKVVDCIELAGIRHAVIRDRPDWHLAPYLSIWAIEHPRYPDWTAWWVICGDLPTDLISGTMIRTPRDALHAFGRLWLEAVGLLLRGEVPSAAINGLGISREDAPLVERQAEFMISWALDDFCWEPEFNY